MGIFNVVALIVLLWLGVAAVWHIQKTSEIRNVLDVLAQTKDDVPEDQLP